MIDDNDLKEIKPKPPAASGSSTHVQAGLPVPKAARVSLLAPGEWENFVEEWATSLTGSYKKLRRLGGSGDKGVDVVGFASDKGFQGEWDNYQCKQYDHPLRPSDVWLEIGKLIYYSYIGEYIPPQKHFFVASKGVGTTLERLLNDVDKLKEHTRANWSKYCANDIISTGAVELSGDFMKYFEDFDFSIFDSKSLIDVIQGHSTTGYHTIRFGGGLPLRPDPSMPPTTPGPHESRYIRQLLDAYGDHLCSSLIVPADLNAHEPLRKDFLRQRERFYHAEALRNFARDTVPDGTFESLQEEIFHGVVDICGGTHPTGLERMRSTITQAAQIAVTANPLAPATKAQDRQGICHQLANEDRLTWVPDND